MNLHAYFWNIYWISVVNGSAIQPQKCFTCQWMWEWMWDPLPGNFNRKLISLFFLFLFAASRSNFIAIWNELVNWLPHFFSSLSSENKRHTQICLHTFCYQANGIAFRFPFRVFKSSFFLSCSDFVQPSKTVHIKMWFFFFAKNVRAQIFVWKFIITKVFGHF